MKKLFFVFSVAASLLLFGCATKITTQVTRPAELDLNGAKTLSVLPFQPNPWNSQSLDVLDFFLSPLNESIDKRRICEDLTERLTMGFLNADYMEMVSASSVKSAIERGREIPCDVYLTGYINHYDERIDRHEFERDDRITIEYSKTVNLTIVYEIIDASTKRVVSHRYKDIYRSSSYYKSKRDLPYGYDLVRDDLRYLSQEIFRKIQPYRVNVTFKLLSDKSKDPQIQRAHEMAKNYNLVGAKDLFLEAYKRTGLFECAYNAAILLEALQDYGEAENIMEKLYKETYDKRAEKALLSIRSERRYASKLNAQESARRDSDDDDDDDFYDYDDDDDDFDW